jgi:hypothetical protein
MISSTTADIAKAIGDDVEFLHTALNQLDEVLDLVERGPERDAIIRKIAKVRLLNAELPMRIASHSPFKDRAHVLACSQGEVRLVLMAITEAQLFLKAHCPDDGMV